MLKKIVLCAAVLTLLAACSKSAEPVATDTVTETESASPSADPSPSASPEPTDRKVGDCVIKPATDCRGDDLRRANLHDARLPKANLSEANLAKSDLKYANLRKANLHRAILRNADVKWAKLNNADLSEADLVFANLEGANLRGADIDGANLRGAYICKTIWTDGKVRNTSCEPSPAPSPSPSASPTSQAAAVRIVNLSGPGTVDCDGGNKVTVTIDFKLRAATTWKLLVDGDATGQGGQPPSSPWSSSANVRLRCGNEASHKITMVASNQGGSISKAITVSFSS